MDVSPAVSLKDVSAVVLPAWVEHQPRWLLRAVTAGVPVVPRRPAAWRIYRA